MLLDEAATGLHLLSHQDREQTVRADVVLEPATIADMRGSDYVERRSLEVVYDQA